MTNLVLEFVVENCKQCPFSLLKKDEKQTKKYGYHYADSVWCCRILDRKVRKLNKKQVIEKGIVDPKCPLKKEGDKT